MNPISKDSQAPGQPVMVLGIESSCDETAVCLYSSAEGVVAEQLFSQIDLHQIFGGVVPELASRDHLRRCLLLIDTALQSAGLDKSAIDCVAYTAGPGLMGALFVGACLGRSLAFALQKPFIAVHHMEAHLLVPMLDTPVIKPPFVALLVSGGHSQFYLVRAIGDYELIGETLDDAAGEAFDKVAKMLGLAYPGGPALAALASTGQPLFHLPRPMCDRPGLDLSFSGLKTATLQLIHGLERSGELDLRKADVAASFQEAVVDTLCRKAKRAIKMCGVSQLVIAGGVSANLRLRQAMRDLTQRQRCEVFYPALDRCTDNGVMVAYAGWHAWQQGRIQHDHNLPVGVKARWPLTSV